MCNNGQPDEVEIRYKIRTFNFYHGLVTTTIYRYMVKLIKRYSALGYLAFITDS